MSEPRMVTDYDGSQRMLRKPFVFFRVIRGSLILLLARIMTCYQKAMYKFYMALWFRDAMTDLM